MSATESSNAEQQLREVVDKMIATLNEIDAKRPQPKAWDDDWIRRLVYDSYE